MKLYTEEQVREAFDKGYKYAQMVRPASIEFHYKYVEGEINSLTPIELPSDEDIDKNGYHDKELNDIWIDACKWVIKQIKQQDNGTPVDKKG